MAPFKAFFTGKVKPPRVRIATCQRCVRTGDIENVGRTARHQTYFEMLGNFSFGDYFKESAIPWAWEFLTEVCELPREKLWVSIYPKDDEAEAIWLKQPGLTKDRIVRLDGRSVPDRADPTRRFTLIWAKSAVAGVPIVRRAVIAIGSLRFGIWSSRNTIGPKTGNTCRWRKRTSTRARGLSVLRRYSNIRCRISRPICCFRSSSTRLK